MEVKLKVGEVKIIPQEFNEEYNIWDFIVEHKNRFLRFEIGEGTLKANDYSILGDEIGNMGDFLLFENGILDSSGKYILIKITHVDHYYYMDLNRYGLSEFTRFIDRYKHLIVFEILYQFGYIDLGIFEYVKEDVKPFLKNPHMLFFRIFYEFVEGIKK